MGSLPSGSPAYKYIRKSDKLPSVGAILGDIDDPICRVKLFNPTGAGTWWIAGHDPDTGECFGVAEINCREVGSFDLNELAEYRGRFGLPIERDLHFKPTRLREIAGLDDEPG